MKTLKDYYRLLISSGIAIFADAIYDFYIILTIYSLNENINTVGIMIASSLFFRSITSVLIGIIVDKINKKLLLIITSILSILIVSSLFLLLKMNLPVYVFIGLILLHDFVNGLFTRCLLTVSSIILGSIEFVKYQAISSTVVKISEIMGIMLAGLLLSFISSNVSIAIIIICFISVIIFILPLKIPQHKKDDGMSRTEKSNFGIKKYKKNLFTGPVFSFVLVISILNLAYGYIPKILPLITVSDDISPMFISYMRLALIIGEMIGLSLVTKWPKKISINFIIGLVGSLVSLVLTILLNNIYLVIITFGLYGLFDSLTQPLFSYIVTTIPNKFKATILGVVDTILLFVAPFGIILGSFISSLNSNYLVIYFSFVFLLALIIFYKSKTLNNIELSNEDEQ